MTTLIPKFEQIGSTTNRPINKKFEETVSVTDFGAVGDGVANDSVAIQTAIDTGKKLYFPEGTYLCNITIPSFFDWQGDGALNTTLKPYNISSPVVSYLYEGSWIYSSITDIGFESTGTQTGIGFCFGNPTAYVVGMEICGRVVFNRCSFTNFNKGVYKPYGNIGNEFNYCSWVDNNYGYFAQSNDIPNPSAPIMHSGCDNFNGGEAHGNLIAAFAILNTQAGGGQWNFNQIIAEYNPGFGVYFDSGSLGNLYNPLVFNNMWFEGNASAASVNIQTTSGVQTLTPSERYIKSADTGFNSFAIWGLNAEANGIGTLNPAAPLGIWGNQRAALRLIGGGYGADNTRLAFSAVGSESTDGATIESQLISGTTRNMLFSAGAKFNILSMPSGSVLIGNNAISGTWPTDGAHYIYTNGPTTVNTHVLSIGSTTGGNTDFYVADDFNANAAQSPVKVGRITSTGRSINAGGTVNASGADYAEYMTKAGDFTIAKGDICGIDTNGNLTNIFADAVSFVVKSTNPSYVGGDTWANEKVVGEKPILVEQKRAVYAEDKVTIVTPAESDESYALKVAKYEAEIKVWEEKIEAARQNVDRIAFSGQVPVNIYGATVGDYIVPVNNNGSISGVSVSTPSFEEYQKAIGKVIAIENDNRARIIVKIA